MEVGIASVRRMGLKTWWRIIHELSFDSDLVVDAQGPKVFVGCLIPVVFYR